MFPTSLAPKAAPEEMIIWNVGQGQWVTFQTEKSCDHFDLGGERFPTEVLNFCQHRENRIALTHWDQDHVNFVRRFLRGVHHSCLYVLPFGDHRLRQELKRIPTCSRTDSSIQVNPAKNPERLSSNARSHIFLWKRRFLVTGDATQETEKRLEAEVLSSVTHYVAGHHGSRTSSSNQLIQRMIHLQMVITSARHRKYGHPHPEVLKKFQKNKTPVLKTEDWGHIRIQI